MKKSFLRTAILLSFASIIILFNSAKANEHKRLQSAILSINKTTDTISGETNLLNAIEVIFHEHGIKSKVAKEIVANVFLAKFYAKNEDGISIKGNRLFVNALAQAKSINNSSLTLWVCQNFGFYLYTYRKYEQSFPLFVTCLQLMEKLSAEEIFDIRETYKKTGYFLKTVGDYEKSSEYLAIAMQYAMIGTNESAAILDNIGLNYLSVDALDKAEAYFSKAKIIAQNQKDNLRYAKVLGNLATIRLKQKQYLQAEALLKEDLRISKQLSDTPNIIFANTLLGKVYLASEQLATAEKVLYEAQQYALLKPYLKRAVYETTTLLLQIAKRTNNGEEELAARRMLDDLGNDLNDLDGDNVIIKVRWALEKEKVNVSLIKEKEERRKDRILNIATLIGCIILVVIIVFILKRYKRKLKDQHIASQGKIALLIQAKNDSEMKLSVSNKNVDAYKAYLDEKNEQIKSLKMEMVQLNTNTDESFSEKYKEDLEALLKTQLLTNETWLQFKEEFIAQNYGYYSNLINSFEGLTDSNFRIIFLLKMGLNNVEVARVLGLTLEAVKKAKQRLKKRYTDKYEQLLG